MTAEKDQPPIIPLLTQTPGAGRTLWRCFSYLHGYRRYVIGAYLLLFAINGLTRQQRDINTAEIKFIGHRVNIGAAIDEIRTGATHQKIIASLTV